MHLLHINRHWQAEVRDHLKSTCKMFSFSNFVNRFFNRNNFIFIWIFSNYLHNLLILKLCNMGGQMFCCIAAVNHTQQRCPRDLYVTAAKREVKPLEVSKEKVFYGMWSYPVRTVFLETAVCFTVSAFSFNHDHNHSITLTTCLLF